MKRTASAPSPSHSRGIRGRAKSRQGGFSLVEVLLSAVVFTLGATATLSLLLISQQDSNQSNYRNDAAEMAQTLVALAELDRASMADFADGAATPHASRASWNVAVADRIPCVGCGSQTSVAMPLPNTLVVTVNWARPVGSSGGGTATVSGSFTVNAFVTGN